MTKPKFTPDPPPYLQGMSIEEAFPLFVDWVIRQEYRKEDWWPKDYEKRVQTLEELSPYCIGDWVIADAAHVSFAGNTIIDGTTACDILTWAYDTGVSGGAFDYLGQSLSMQKDFSSFIAGRQNGQTPEIWVYSGGWSNTGNVGYPTGGEDYDQFGDDLDYSEDTGVLVVGAPYSDDFASDGGQCFVYLGSNALGWTYSHAITPPSPRNFAHFGAGVGISGDGSVLAIGSPATDSVLTMTIDIYDHQGSGVFNHRNTITKTLVSGDSGFGYALTLNEAGTILGVGWNAYGVGAQGAVIIYDDVSGTFTERQTITRPNFTTYGIPGGPQSANTYFFGQDIAFSSDMRSMIVGMPSWQNGANLGGCLIFELNTTTNEYEYCNYLSATSSGNAGYAVAVDMTAGTRRIFFGAPFVTTNLGEISFYNE